jgi:pimeloyl-ACP methyl ester carboxylesterase
MAFPQDFEVPVDEGGPPFQRVPVGGFGGNPGKTQDEHRAVVQSVGKAPVLLIHGNGGSADTGRWDMLDLNRMLIEAGYQKELIWAPSYLGTIGGFGGIPDLMFPHAHNVGEVREFIDNVCEYLDVEAVDIIAHSLGCTLAYSVFRGLQEQDAPMMNSWNWNQPKKWHRVGTFIALAGAFHGLGTNSFGEWDTDGEFVRELLAETHGGGGETPFDITYFCGIAEEDFIDTQNPGTGKLEGATNSVHLYNLDGKGRHERIKEDPGVFSEFLPLLNSAPPVARVTMVVDKNSGNYESPLTITLDIDPPDRIVSYEANRVTKEFMNGYIVGKIVETVTGEFIGGQKTLVLPTDGMWEVAYRVEGAAEDEKRTYWVGATEIIEAAIDTDNSTSFEGSLDVKASTTRGKLYNSLYGGGWSEAAVPLDRNALNAVVYGEGWSEGDIVTIAGNATVYFIAIDPEGTASQIISRSFKKGT